MSEWRVESGEKAAWREKRKERERRFLMEARQA